jgi:hypothetical protein
VDVMNVQDIQIKIYQLTQFCEQVKIQLSAGEKNLQNLSKMIVYQTGPSRTGKEAAQILNQTAKRTKETVQNIITLEKELNEYMQQILS